MFSLKTLNLKGLVMIKDDPDGNLFSGEQGTRRKSTLRVLMTQQKETWKQLGF